MYLTFLKNAVTQHPVLSFALIGTLAGLSVGVYEVRHKGRKPQFTDKIISIVARMAVGIFTSLIVQQSGKYIFKAYRHYNNFPSA